MDLWDSIILNNFDKFKINDRARAFEQHYFRNGLLLKHIQIHADKFHTINEHYYCIRWHKSHTYFNLKRALRYFD